MRTWLTETTNGAILSMLRIFGGETSPARPGEPVRKAIPGMPGDEFKRYQDDKMGLNGLTGVLYPNITREQLVEILDDMDATGIVSSVLDMMSSDAIQVDPNTGKSFKVRSKDKSIQSELERLFTVLDMEECLPIRMRAMCKYGTDLSRLIYSTNGVSMLVPTRPKDIDIVTDRNTYRVVGYKEQGRKFRNKNNEVSWPWDYLAWSLPPRDETNPWGVGVVVPGIRSWTQLALSEDFALMYRITRHPDRLKFKIDVGTMPEDEAAELVQDVRRRMRKRSVLDPVRAMLKQEYDPMNVMEDFFMAVRPNSNSDIDILPGSNNVQDVTDVQYYAQKFLAEVGVPASVFGIGAGTSMDEPTRRNKKMVNQDVQYARRVKRIQKSAMQALTRLGEVHLALRNSGTEDPLFDFLDENNKPLFSVEMQPPSFLEELERMEVMQLRAQLANEHISLMSGAGGTIRPYEWTLYVLRDILRIDSDKVRSYVQQPPAPDAEGGGEGPAFSARPSRPELPPDMGSRERAERKRKVTTEKVKLFDATNGGDLTDESAAMLATLLERSPKLQEQIARLKQLTES